MYKAESIGLVARQPQPLHLVIVARDGSSTVTIAIEVKPSQLEELIAQALDALGRL